MAAWRALPSRRAWGPDALMLLAGMVAIGAGVFAYLAVKEPWVRLTISRSAENADLEFVASLSMRAKTALIGTGATGLAIAVAVLGLAWFFYGLQRGWTMPGPVNPAFGMVVAIVGLLATVLSSTVWFVWEDALVLRAKVAGLSTQAMKDLLDQQPPPLVQIQRLSGLMMFGGMMVLGFLASCLGWYAYRRRG